MSIAHQYRQHLLRATRGFGVRKEKGAITIVVTAPFFLPHSGDL